MTYCSDVSSFRPLSHWGRSVAQEGVACGFWMVGLGQFKRILMIALTLDKVVIRIYLTIQTNYKVLPHSHAGVMQGENGFLSVCG